MSRLNFKLEATADGSRARAGRFRTLHNEVLTPLFMPVGTQATVRHTNFDVLEKSGSQILLANTYHLLLRPGPEVFQKLGGIHGLTKWSKSFLTDSGGFQIFSLPKDRRITEEGARFKSYIDGREYLLSPESSIETQKIIGSDIMMVLDECVPSTVDKSEAQRAMELTHRWALRSLKARGDSPQSLFAIVQGACYKDLRRESARVLTQMPFDGFAIGGLAVGESKDEREEFTAHTTDFLPKDLPRYLMGVGTPLDLLEAVHRGVDMFDCIIPTAHGEQGVAYTSRGRLRISRGVYKFLDEALDPNCDCFVCKTYSKAYLHHLIKANEGFGRYLLSSHNIYFYHAMMRDIRASILNNTFVSLYNERRRYLAADDQENPPVLPRATRKKNKRVLTLGDFELVQTLPQEDGIITESFWSVRHRSSGEVMHSVSPPDQEAQRLYVSAFAAIYSSLSPKLESNPFVVWDVGMGAAHNAMALIHHIEKLASEGLHLSQQVQILSFEKDLNALKLVLENPQIFPHVRHQAPGILLSKGEWISSKAFIRWKLLEGSYSDHYAREELPKAHLVFWDPFSYKTNPELWTLEVFEELKTRLAQDALLSTYTASTAIRTAMALAGFWIYRGPSSGPKNETTWASTQRLQSLSDRLIGSEFLLRFERSDVLAPPMRVKSMAATWNKDKVLDKLRAHPQFLPLAKGLSP
jgi:queuine tRNA-ribosyltransferase